MEDPTDPKSIKIRSLDVSKKDLNIEGSCDRNFVDFFMIFAHLASTRKPILIGKTNGFCTSHIWILSSIQLPLGPKKVPIWRPFSMPSWSKNGHVGLPNRCQKMIQFLKRQKAPDFDFHVDFGSHLGVQMSGRYRSFSGPRANLS